ncbi:GH25 family lysozyme [Streptomyces sp. NPDC002589]|uniref:GH25 family lysozyme n=1 Tax=Streptomyces sp. NPDC002589 TaxID=3154420 RepID=UPI00332944F4
MRLIVLVATLVSLFTLGSAPASADARVCPPANSLLGVDVSQFQGSIDWTQVANAGYSFAYARIGDGLFSDQTFQTNFTGIKAAGMKAGGYLHFEPAEDPHAQAHAVITALSQAGFAPGDLIPALDVETTGGVSPSVVVANLHAAVNDIQAALGVPPAIYTTPFFWHQLGTPPFGSDPLWIAQLGVDCPTAPTPWTTWSLWQYSSQGSVPGIPGPTDLDRAFGTTLPIYDPLITATGTPVSAQLNGNFSGQTASFTDPDPNATAAEYSALINWGDGTPIATATITANPSGGFTVTGTHTYTHVGSFTVGTEITDRDNTANRATVTTTATVAYGTKLLYNPTQPHNSGSTIPIRVELVDANGTNVSSSAVPLTITGLTPNPSPGTPPATGSQFRFTDFDGTPGYIFNLRTGNFPDGSYNLLFTAGSDPTVHKAPFVINWC